MGNVTLNVVKKKLIAFDCNSFRSHVVSCRLNSVRHRVRNKYTDCASRNAFKSLFNCMQHLYAAGNSSTNRLSQCPENVHNGARV